MVCGGFALRGCNILSFVCLLTRMVFRLPDWFVVYLFTDGFDGLCRTFRAQPDGAAAHRFAAGRAGFLCRCARSGRGLAAADGGFGSAARDGGGGGCDFAHARSVRLRVGRSGGLSEPTLRCLRSGFGAVAGGGFGVSVFLQPQGVANGGEAGGGRLCLRRTLPRRGSEAV